MTDEELIERLRKRANGWIGTQDIADLELYGEAADRLSSLTAGGSDAELIQGLRDNAYFVRFTHPAGAELMQRAADRLAAANARAVSAEKERDALGDSVRNYAKLETLAQERAEAAEARADAAEAQLAKADPD